MLVFEASETAGIHLNPNEARDQRVDMLTKGSNYDYICV